MEKLECHGASNTWPLENINQEWPVALLPISGVMAVRSPTVVICTCIHVYVMDSTEPTYSIWLDRRKIYV